MLEIIQIDQAKLDDSLTLIKHLIEPRFPEAPKSKNPQGAKRKWPRWLIVALALFQPCLPFSWREYADQIKRCEPVLQAHGAKEAPSYSSIYKEWRNIPRQQIENLIRLTGKVLCPEPEDTAIDSTGFLFKAGSVWILLKWAVRKLKKTSKVFYKAHVIVEVKKKVILGVRLSKSPDHDLTVGIKLIFSLGKRMLAKIRRIYGDKAYTDGDLALELQDDFGVKMIVEPKSNAVDHGTNSLHDRNVRLYQNSPELWKYTNGHGQKSTVERIIGVVKQYPLTMTARLNKTKKKQLVMRYFVYNFNLLLRSA